MPDPRPPRRPNLDRIRTFTPRVMRWGFGSVMGVMLFISALSYWRVEVGNQALNEIVSHEQAAAELLYRMQFTSRDRTFALFKAVHTDDPFERDSALQLYYAQGAAFGEARRALMALPLTPFEQDLLEQQRQQTIATMPLQYQVIELLEAGNIVEAERILIDQALPAQNRMIELLTALLDDALDRTREHAETGERAQHRANVLFVLGGLVGLLLIWGVFMLVTRKMSGLITYLTDTSERLHLSNQDLEFQKLALDEHNIVSVADVHGNIIDANEKFCEISQYSRRELLGQNHRLLKSGNHPDAFYEELWATISAGKVWRGEICNRRKDGTLYWVASTILPFLGEDGLPVRYVSVRTDITAIKEAQHVLERSRDELEQLVKIRSRELVEREEILHTITDTAQDAVIMVDSSESVTYWNPAATKMFGYSEAEALGKNLHALVVPERDQKRAHAGFLNFVRTGVGTRIGQTTTLTARHQSDREFPVDISLSAIQLRGQWNVTGIIRDASERVQTEERLKQLATTDTLTGICNRRRFDEALASELERASRFNNPMALILFDVDHFKRINDSVGHQAGDQVLIQLTRTVGDAIRATDLFARWGGEEFVVLVPESDLEGGRILAEKLRERIQKQAFADIRQVTCSFGVVEYRSGDTADTLMSRVDRGLYQAKAEGRNRVVTMKE